MLAGIVDTTFCGTAFWGWKKENSLKKRGITIQECGRTGAGQLSPFFLQIAKICLDWREKIATIY